jgi:hypothetical protein
MHGGTGAVRLDQLIDETFDELKGTHRGHKNDYYGLIFLERSLHNARSDQVPGSLA